ncbi:MAG: hypothetical protein HYV28_11890 [Ignavibacteriales bacterium]|nr:hypothetical protein [Ignavibacteriales bacterium]
MAKKSFAVKPLVFPDKTALRQWFAENHKTATEAHLGFYKKASGKKSATYHEAVTEALCFGWIDSIAHSIDDEIYAVRFTPRKAKSIWSKVNLKKIEELKSLGLMTPAGLAVYENRDPKKENLYSAAG